MQSYDYFLNSIKKRIFAKCVNCEWGMGELFFNCLFSIINYLYGKS